MSQNQNKLNERLWAAAEAGNIGQCRNLLRHGADLHAGARFDYTALHKAAAKGRAEMCQFLIGAGADVLRKNDRGTTPLHLAAGQPCVETCRVLVAHGADLSAQRTVYDSETVKHTPLHVAVAAGQIDIVRYFVEECGEDLDQLTSYGKSLVQLADSYKKKRMVAFLPQYRNSLKIEQAVAEALQVEDVALSPSRSRGPSPL